MKELPLVTVYVVSYNNYDKILQTIQNIVEQDYSRMELIVSDDGSEGFDAEQMNQQLSQYTNRFENIIVNKNKKNLGTVKHVNKVLKMATGDIYCSLGADDTYYCKSTISQIVDFFLCNPDKLIVTSKRMEKDDGSVRPSKYLLRVLEKNPEKFRRIMLRTGVHISGAGTYFRKELFLKHGYFLENDFFLLEDASYLTHILMRGEKIGLLNEITWCHAAGGVTDKKNPRASRAYLEYFEVNRKLLYPQRDKFDFLTRRCIEFQYFKNLANSRAELIKVGAQYFDAFLWTSLYWLPDLIGIRKS